jgi:AP2 domain
MIIFIDRRPPNLYRELMFDKVYARKLVRDHHLPITIDQYNSGQIGFVARPIVNGKRLNRSFSTSVYGNLEEAAQAAIAFCKQKEQEVKTERLEKRESELDRMVEQAVKRGLDPVGVFRTGLLIHVKRQVKKELENE